MRSAAARSGEATVPVIVAVVPPLLRTLAVAAGASDLGLVLVRDQVAARVRPLLPSVRKSGARVRERGVAWRPLVPVPVPVGVRLRNEPARVDISVPLLRGRKSDAVQMSGVVDRPRGARAAEEIGGCMRVMEEGPNEHRLTGTRLRAVEIGASRREAMDRREQLADTGILASPVTARMAGPALLIAVLRTTEARVLVDTLTTRSMARKVAATSAMLIITAGTLPTLITADTSATPIILIMATPIAAVTDTERISPPTVMATEVMRPATITASRTAVVDTDITTLSAAIIPADSLITATVLMATVMWVTERMVGAASAITSVVVLDTSAIRDTATVGAMAMLMGDSPATAIEVMVDGATAPASIAGKGVAASPIIITWFRHADTASAGIAANGSSAGL